MSDTQKSEGTVRRWRFDIPVDAGALSPNKNMRNHQARARITREHRDAAWMTWRAAGKPRTTHRVRLDAIICRYGALDPTNRWACLKAIVDGICIGALTPNDTASNVQAGEVGLVNSKGYLLRPHVIIIATEL